MILYGGLFDNTILSLTTNAYRDSITQNSRFVSRLDHLSQLLWLCCFLHLRGLSRIHITACQTSVSVLCFYWSNSALVLFLFQISILQVHLCTCGSHSNEEIRMSQVYAKPTSNDSGIKRFFKLIMDLDCNNKSNLRWNEACLGKPRNQPVNIFPFCCMRGQMNNFKVRIRDCRQYRLVYSLGINLTSANSIRPNDK